MGFLSKIIIGTFVIIFVFCCSQVVQASYATLTCTDIGLNVTFQRSVVENDGRPYTINFKGVEPGCYVDSSNTSNIQDNTIWISALYSECGIEAKNINFDFTYNQTVIVTYGRKKKNPKANDPKTADFDYFELTCAVPYNFTLDYTSSKKNIVNVTSVGTRIFQKSQEFQFSVKMDRISPTTKLVDTSGTTRVGDTLQFSLNATLSTRNQFQLFPQDCYVTEQANGNFKYSLLKNKCANPDDPTVKLVDKNGPSVTLSFMAFRFVGLNTNQIYVTCQVLICKSMGIGEIKYVNGCAYCGSRRRRREISSSEEGQTSRATISSGLIVILDEDKQETGTTDEHGSDNFFTGTKGTIILILLIILILMGIAYIVKKILTPTRSHTSATMEEGIDNFALHK